MPSDTATPAKQATCEDRVSEHLAYRLKDLEYLYGDPDLSDADVLRDIVGAFGFDLTWIRDYLCPDQGDSGGCGNEWTAPENGPLTCPDCGYRGCTASASRVSESDDEIREKLYEARNEYGLCFDYCPVEPAKDEDDDDDDENPGFFRYQLSTGGPGDEFRFFCGPGFDCYRIEYWFLDWFDGAHRTLHGADKKLLLSVFADFKECGSVEAAFDRGGK